MSVFQSLLTITFALGVTCFSAQAETPAKTFAETAFTLGVLENMPEGEKRDYHHNRLIAPKANDQPQSPPGAPPSFTPLAPIESEIIRLERTTDEAGKPILKLDALQNDANRPISSFAPSGPHPVLLYFFENIMRAMAQQTGGNPHYIRNQLRISLGQQPVTIDENGEASIRYRPFENDPNAAKMQVFSGLEIEVRWPADNPGLLLLLKAGIVDNDAEYSEILTLSAPE